jgi:hypothetical protein
MAEQGEVSEKAEEFQSGIKEVSKGAQGVSNAAEKKKDIDEPGREASSSGREPFPSYRIDKGKSPAFENVEPGSSTPGNARAQDGPFNGFSKVGLAPQEESIILKLPTTRRHALCVSCFLF